MAHVVSFEISGLAGRQEVVRHDLRDVNVFWGPNGSGKTSMLKILESALTFDAMSLVNVPFERAVVRVYSADWDATIERTLDRRALVREQPMPSQEVPIWFDEDEEIRHVPSSVTWTWQSQTISRGRQPEVQGAPYDEDTRLLHRFLPISRMSYVSAEQLRRTGRSALSEETLDTIFANDTQQLWQRNLIDASVEIQAAQDRGLALLLGNVLTAEDPRPVPEPISAEEAWRLINDFFNSRRELWPSNLRDLEQWRVRYDKSPAVQHAVQELRAVQERVDRAQEPQRRMMELISDLYGGGKHVRFERDLRIELPSGQMIPITRLSSGEKQLLRLLVECLGSRNGSLIIDEPELSLHVDWQNRLVGAMRTLNSTAQIIMATHSPEIMAHLEDEMIFEL